MRYLRFVLCFLLLGMPVLFASSAAFAQVAVSVTIAPPELPVYDQPVCPGDGYIWTPGYWAWDGDDYYWVPGTWVLAPEVGYLWTPPYWGWGGSAFFFHAGYWGPVVGFYGGINYGFGYFGHGFVGGRWEGGHFFYNSAVWHVDTHVIRNVYEERVNVRENVRVSYNGGRGGIDARPTREEEAAEHERHLPPVQDQIRHEEAARSNRELRNSVNHGRPPVTATPRPGEFSGHEAAPGRETTRAETPSGHTNNPVHPKDLPAYQRPAAPNTGNTKTDQKYQKQQENLAKTARPRAAETAATARQRASTVHKAECQRSEKSAARTEALTADAANATTARTAATTATAKAATGASSIRASGVSPEGKALAVR